MTTTFQIYNKRAKYDYDLKESFVVGIVLNGHAVKSLRNGKGSIIESHCAITDNELYLYNSNIGNITAPLKLLAHKREIRYLFEKTQTKGYTIIPVKLFLCHGLWKAEISLAKGKHNYDKRQSIKEREDKINISRILKQY